MAAGRSFKEGIMKIRISGIANDSVVDGPGIRLTVFTQGCPHKCLGCHNPDTHSYSGGKEIDTEEIIQMINQNPLLDGVTFSGGEPFLHTEALSIVAAHVKKSGLNLIIYTGYLWEEIIKNENMLHLALYADIIIDGKFILAERSLDLRFRGSKNQRAIDPKESMRLNRAVEINI